MDAREEAVKRFVADYPIQVPEEMVEQEYQDRLLILRHQMAYSRMTGSTRMNPLEQMRAQEELKEELRAAAYDAVKEDLVLQDVMEKSDVSVTQEELMAYAQEMAQRQNTTIEMIRRFFGDNLAMLERDVKRQKAVDQICAQTIL